MLGGPSRTVNSQRRPGPQWASPRAVFHVEAKALWRVCTSLQQLQSTIKTSTSEEMGPSIHACVKVQVTQIIGKHLPGTMQICCCDQCNQDGLNLACSAKSGENGIWRKFKILSELLDNAASVCHRILMVWWEPLVFFKMMPMQNCTL